MRHSPVPMQMWGKDHWSTLLYIECRAVDNKGKLDRRQMRCDSDLHPMLDANARILGPDRKKYPTLLKDKTKILNHDDWSCIEDMQAVGLLSCGALGASIMLTNKGWEAAGKLRRWRAEGNRVGEFSYE